MALKIFEKFDPRANPIDGNYSTGSIKNETVPGANDGTPLDADWGNDEQGFTDALLDDAGIAHSGNPDTVVLSDRLVALRIAANKAAQTPVTLASVIADTKLKLNMVRIVSDRNFGKFDIIAKGTTPGVDLPDGFGVIQCVGVPTLVMSLRIVSIIDFKQFGAGVVGNNIAAMTAALAVTTIVKQVRMDDATFDLEFGEITIPGGVTIEGNGILLGRMVVGGDRVTLKGFTLTGQTGIDTNGFNGLNCIDWSDLLVEDVTFDTCTVINTNDKLVFKKNYRYINCKFKGDMLADEFAAAFSAGNLAELFVNGCTFEQENLYRLIKLTSTGYAVDELVDDSFNRRIIFSGNSMAGSMRVVAPNDIIDTFSSATKTIFDTNIITTTGGVDVFASKSGGGTGPRTTQHREIMISNNIIRTDVSQVVMTMAGAVGQVWEGEEQNISIINNQILCSNNLATTAIEVRAFHRGIVANNDITYTGTFANFAGIKIRSVKHASVSGGFIKKGNMTVIGSPTEGEISRLTVDGLAIIEGAGRGIDMNSMIGTDVVISGCNIDASGNNPIRVKDSALNYLVTSGNVNDNAANGVDFNLGTTVKHVDVGNIWN